MREVNNDIVVIGGGARARSKRTRSSGRTTGCGSLTASRVSPGAETPRLPPMPVDNGELAGYIDDQQGAFNLNNLATGGKISVVQFERFRRLLWKSKRRITTSGSPETFA